MEIPIENTSEKVEISAPEGTGAQSGDTNDMISQFDEILGKNFDRLLGVRQGIETLPMNIFTVSCLILLAARETEIQGFPYLPPERYTHESLLKDMSEMNIEHGGDLERYINSMLDKGYIKVENDGRMFPGAPIMKMGIIFDRIFPKMPGLNLVAYLGQMIDEVLYKRKSLDAALNQFDQMLSLQGVPLIRDIDSSHQETVKAFPHLRVSETVPPVKKKIFATDIKPSNIYSKLKTKTWIAPQSKVETYVSSFDPDQGGIEKEVPADSPIQPVAGADISAEVKEQDQDMKILADQEEAESQANVSPGQLDLSGYEEHVSSIDEPVSVRGYDQDFNSQPEDDDIEKKIAAFEEELSMKCPLCRTERIVPSTTARGKTYYKCSNEECNFISWGKPYYISCPTCKNPFLIETPDTQGIMILKCPRTTCPHWQKFPWNKDEGRDIKSLAKGQVTDAVKKPRRVVRRRKRVVVRRKS